MMLAPLLLSTYTISFATAAIGPLIDPLSDSQFSTNSMISNQDACEPWDAKYTVSHQHDGWCAAHTNFGAPNGPYLEINFGRKTNIHAIATKGRGCCDQYVASYILSYYDGNAWIQYDSGFVFVGNNNDNGNYQEEVRHELINYNGLVTTQYIRFYPITYGNHASMRVEAYGNDWTASPTESPSKPPSLNPTLQPIQPTSQPTVSPNNIPTIDPTYDPSLSPTQVTLPPTNDPTLTPTNDPTSDPTKHPTSNPTHDPTLGPSNNPTSSPTNPPTFPSLHPSKNPTSDPTVDPTFHPTDFTFNPTLTPSENPTVSTSNPTLRPSTHPTASPTTNMPTVYPTEVDVEVRDETIATRNGAGVNGESPSESIDNLPSWVYILAACAAVLCCLTIALIVWKCRRDVIKQNIAREDTYRQEMNLQSNMKQSMDIWTNPVHHQTNFMNHVGTDNTTLLHLAENDDGEGGITPITQMTMDTNDTNSSEIEMNNMSQNGFNDEEVLDDIMETPMGPNVNNDDDDIDDINNDIDDVNYNNNDDDVLVDNIDNNYLVTAGGDDDDDDIVTTKGGYDDDIDAINNNIENEELVNDIDSMITKGDDNYTAEGGDTDDVTDEMETPFGDDSIIIDDINMNEEDEDIFENEDFIETLQ